MSFRQKTQRALTLASESWSVLREQKSLLVLPLISGILVLFVLLTFVVPFALSPEVRQIFVDNETTQTEIYDYALLFVLYLVLFAIVTYFNAAFVYCVIGRLSGTPRTIGEGLAMATRRLPQILAWALVSSTIGLVLNLLRDRGGILGQIAAGLAGFAWSVASYFVVPVLVVEGVGPLGAVERSVAILRRTWGEALIANFGVGLLFILPVMLLVLLGALAATILPPAALVALFVAAVILAAVIGLVVNALSVTIQSAIYLYATSGHTPGQFDQSLLANAFRPKH